MNGEILLYQSSEGKTIIDVRLEGETVWLTQAQLAVLFQTTKQNISLHISNIYKEGELEENATVKDFLTVRKEGRRNVKRQLLHYNLDVIIAVGYRVKSHIATRFRIWATNMLKEYLIKGFILDDERLKEAKSHYFEELLARIRDIRSSEKIFWRKVLDIYATSIDYDPNTEDSRLFFKTVQNKMHWAAHGNTAAEVIFNRIDASKPYLGLTSFKGEKPQKREAQIAKNYLSEVELDVLNRMVTAYVEVAEIQATSRIPMYMKDWLARIDDFLKLTGKEILGHAGKISHEMAMKKAAIEYSTYKELTKNDLSRAELHFFDHIERESKKLKKGKND